MSDNGGGWLFFVVDVIFVAALAFGLIYGTMMWRTRGKTHVPGRVREQATRDNYREEAEKERLQEERRHHPAA